MHPWGKADKQLPPYVRQSFHATKCRILLDGPCRYAWYLGERVSVQSLGLTSPRVPKVPPASMLGDYPITADEAKVWMGGLDASDFLEPNVDGAGNYRDFVKRHIKFKHYPVDEVSLTCNVYPLIVHASMFLILLYFYLSRMCWIPN